MKRIVFPEMPVDTPLSVYLAAEEWVAQILPEGDYFFAWQVEPTVICGRHQDISAEVNLEYASEQNINIFRRKSGGGAVYADRNNIMFSYITASDSVQTIFSRYTSMICLMLHSLGVIAEPTGRNDISIKGKKVAGNAFLKLPGRSILHGTMLYDADFGTMSRVLTPSRAKRESKGVVSVPSRVTTLRAEGIDFKCNEFINYALGFLCTEGEYVLTPDDMDRINEIAREYTDAKFLNIDKAKRHNDHIYIDGLGEIALDIEETADGRIRNVSLHGDFFHLQDAQRTLTRKLAGIKNDIGSILHALKDEELGHIIAGLNHENLATLLQNS